MQYKKIGNLWNPENKRDIEGKLLKVEKNTEVNGFKYANVYILETSEEIVKVCGSTVIDKTIEGVIGIGDYVKIVFKEKKKPEGGKAYKDFEVYKGVN